MTEIYSNAFKPTKVRQMWFVQSQLVKNISQDVSLDTKIKTKKT